MTNAKTKALSIVNGIKTGFTSKIDALKKSVGTAFESIKSKITKPISDAKATLSGVVKKIAGLFPISLGKILHFSIPKISVSGGKAPWGIGGKGTKPSFDVSWASHAAGGIFRRPTLLQDGGGGNHLVGEAGPEAILPLGQLWAQMDRMADSIVNGVMMSQQIAGAGAGAPMQINLYAFPNGPQMGSWVVNTYDKYKKQLG
jgi:phage-related minor tail protein